MLFYMVTRYHDNTLTLTLDNTGSYGSSPTLGKLDTLVKWHYEDPVSETEIKRNEVVYTYQGNRNPYIDHPEFVYYLYEDESKELGVTENNVLEKVSQEDEEDTTVSELISDIETILGFNRVSNAVLVGVGSLGTAFLHYKGFEDFGLRIVAAFDNNPLLEGIS